MLDIHVSQEIEAQSHRLQEYFSVAIPRLLELIRNKKVTHILLLEKTARVFKEPLIQLVKQQGLDVKIGSFAPDYFPITPDYCPTYSGRIKNENPLKSIGRKQYEKKLQFLPSPTATTYNILMLDDFIQNGTSMDKTQSGLEKLGYVPERIHSCTFDGESIASYPTDVLHGDGTIDELICNFSRFPYSKYGKRGVFEIDRHAVYYARINKKTPERYAEVVRLLTRIILESVE